MSSEQTPRLLFCAFAEVPGPSAAGTRTHQLVSRLSEGFSEGSSEGRSNGFDVDALSLKGPELQHIQRVGAARMMRVPVEGKPFLERLASYQRALKRQLAGDRYDLVFCADVFSAQIAAGFQEAQGFALLVEVNDLPSESFARRHPVDAADERLQGQWREAERKAFRAATAVIVPSRHAARLLGERIDPRLLRVLPRAVDRSVFAPPSVELSLDERRTVLVVGGREGRAELEAVLPLLEALHRALPPERVRLVLAGAAREEDEAVRGRLAESGLAPRVALVDVESPARLAQALCEADVVVVPTSAERSLEPWAVPYRALEAMACRRATVITGPEASCTEALVPGEEALVVPARNPERLVDAVVRLLDGPARREAVAQAGARRVEQQADLGTCIGEVASLLGEHLGMGVPLIARVLAEEQAPASSAQTSAPGASRAVPSKALRPVADRASTSASVFEPASDETFDALLSEEGGAFFEDAFEPIPTEIEQLPEASSLLFTDEAAPALPPAAPPPPSVVDVNALDSELSPPEPSPPEPSPPEPSRYDALLESAPTRVAEPPPGLVDALRSEPAAEPVVDERSSRTGQISGVDAWFGETRIDTDAPSNMTSLAGNTRRDTDVLLTPEPATSSESRPIVRAGPDTGLPPPKALRSSDDPSVATGDPWGHDTIADAAPFLDDGVDSDASRDDTERSACGPAERTSSRGAGGLLVDRSPDITVTDGRAMPSSTEG